VTWKVRGGTPQGIIAESEALSCLKPSPENEALDSTLDGLQRTRGLTTYLDFLGGCEQGLIVPEQEDPMDCVASRPAPDT
jgi:hypothetical protein